MYNVPRQYYYCLWCEILWRDCNIRDQLCGNYHDFSKTNFTSYSRILNNSFLRLIFRCIFRCSSKLATRRSIYIIHRFYVILILFFAFLDDFEFYGNVHIFRSFFGFLEHHLTLKSDFYIHNEWIDFTVMCFFVCICVFDKKLNLYFDFHLLQYLFWVESEFSWCFRIWEVNN